MEPKEDEPEWECIVVRSEVVGGCENEAAVAEMSVFGLEKATGSRDDFLARR